HGEHPAVVVVGRGEAELGEDAGDVLADRALAEVEPLPDRRVRPPLGHELQHLALARGEPAERLGAGGGPAGGGPPGPWPAPPGPPPPPRGPLPAPAPPDPYP